MSVHVMMVWASRCKNSTRVGGSRIAVRGVCSDTLGLLYQPGQGVSLEHLEAITFCLTEPCGGPEQLHV